MSNVNHDDSLTVQANADSSVDMTIQLQMIQRRKAEVVDELEQLNRRRLELEQEANDLAVTERTIARLLDVHLPDTTAVRGPDVAVRRKPRDIPSVYVMAATLLRESGKHWMEASEIIDGIRSRWWPTAEPGDISPTLWRLAKTQKLQKTGTTYALLPGEGTYPGSIGAADSMLKLSPPANGAA